MTAEEKALRTRSRIECGIRLMEFRKSTGLNRKKFAASIQVQVDTQRTYEVGASEPNSFYFKKLKTRYPYADVGYIFTGEPTIITGMKKSDLLPTKSIPVVASIPPEGYSEDVPESDIIGWIPTINLKEPFLFALLVKGNSMAPEVRAGDYAVLAPASTIEPGVIYAVFTKGSKLPQLKEIYRTESGYKLVSADPNEKTVTIGASELLSYYRLMHVYRSFP